MGIQIEANASTSRCNVCVRAFVYALHALARSGYPYRIVLYCTCTIQYNTPPSLFRRDAWSRGVGSLVLHRLCIGRQQLLLSVWLMSALSPVGADQGTWTLVRAGKFRHGS